MSRGAITDWSHMEQIWRHLYKRLGRDPTDQPVILSEPPLNPKYNREKIAEVMGRNLHLNKDGKCVVGAYADSESHDQTALMRSLITVFAVCLQMDSKSHYETVQMRRLIWTVSFRICPECAFSHDVGHAHARVVIKGTSSKLR